MVAQSPLPLHYQLIRALCAQQLDAGIAWLRLSLTLGNQYDTPSLSIGWRCVLRLSKAPAVRRLCLCGQGKSMALPTSWSWFC